MAKMKAGDKFTVEFEVLNVSNEFYDTKLKDSFSTKMCISINVIDNSKAVTLTHRAPDPIKVGDKVEIHGSIPNVGTIAAIGESENGTKFYFIKRSDGYVSLPEGFVTRSEK